MSYLNRFVGLARDRSPAGRARRSRLGLALALAMVPFLAGVMGCFVLPVPIGNPERSRIDPAMTGIWLSNDAANTWIVALEPYDKRTWLVTWIILEESGGEAETPPPSPPADPGETPDESEMEIVEAEPDATPVIERLRRGDYEVTGVAFCKGWLTTIKGVRFMVWEPMAQFTEERGMQPHEWWVQRVESVSESEMDTDPINGDFDDLEKVATTREAVSLIKRHIKDPKLFLEEGTFPDYVRVARSDYELIGEILAGVGVAQPE